jgi:replication-associated recombination protein RarA
LLAPRFLALSTLFGEVFNVSNTLFGRAPLVERYRPATWAEVVGQERVVGRIRQLAERGALAGRAYFLSGQSGTGKTTIARLIAGEVAGPWDVEEMDAGALTESGLRDLERTLSLRGMDADKGGRAVILNEAHGLRKNVIRALLVALERIPPHVVWVFTSTVEGTESLFEDYDDASPLLSRCLRLDLSRRDLSKAFAFRAQEIAEKEGLNGRPIEQYIRLVQKHRQNLRAVLQEIESGAMLAGDA